MRGCRAASRRANRRGRGGARLRRRRRFRRRGKRNLRFWPCWRRLRRAPRNLRRCRCSHRRWNDGVRCRRDRRRWLLRGGRGGEIRRGGGGAGAAVGRTPRRRRRRRGRGHARGQPPPPGGPSRRRRRSSPGWARPWRTEAPPPPPRAPLPSSSTFSSTSCGRRRRALAVKSLVALIVGGGAGNSRPRNATRGRLCFEGTCRLFRKRATSPRAAAARDDRARPRAPQRRPRGPSRRARRPERRASRAGQAASAVARRTCRWSVSLNGETSARKRARARGARRARHPSTTRTRWGPSLRRRRLPPDEGYGRRRSRRRGARARPSGSSFASWKWLRTAISRRGFATTRTTPRDDRFVTRGCSRCFSRFCDAPIPGFRSGANRRCATYSPSRWRRAPPRIRRISSARSWIASPRSPSPPRTSLGPQGPGGRTRRRGSSPRARRLRERRRRAWNCARRTPSPRDISEHRFVFFATPPSGWRVVVFARTRRRRRASRRGPAAGFDLAGDDGASSKGAGSLSASPSAGVAFRPERVHVRRVDARGGVSPRTARVSVALFAANRLGAGVAAELSRGGGAQHVLPRRLRRGEIEAAERATRRSGRAWRVLVVSHPHDRTLSECASATWRELTEKRRRPRRRDPDLHRVTEPLTACCVGAFDDFDAAAAAAAAAASGDGPRRLSGAAAAPYEDNSAPFVSLTTRSGDAVAAMYAHRSRLPRRVQSRGDGGGRGARRRGDESGGARGEGEPRARDCSCRSTPPPPPVARVIPPWATPAAVSWQVSAP